MSSDANVTLGDVFESDAGLPEDLERDRVLANLERHMFGADDVKTVGRFELIRRLGAGGMGVVYEARDPDLDRNVALKLLRSELIDPAVARRLTLEARALAKLRHPNVVTVYEVGTDGDDRFIAMDFVQGGTLREWLSETHPWREIVARFVAAGRGLCAAHDAGLVHRDFKPDNVLVEGDSTRVVDFGLAAESDETQSLEATLRNTLDGMPHGRLTRTGGVVGTPLYMAPEQFDGKATTASDQYSFCIALYEALHGKRPFEEPRGNLHAFVQARMRPVPPGTPRDVPRWLRRALVRGLSPSPEDRWPDMATLLGVLGRASRNPWRRPLMASAVAAVGVVVGGGAMALQEQASSCEERLHPLHRVWNPQRRETLRQAFEATGLAHAPTVWTTVEADLDAFAEQWKTERLQVCEMSHAEADPGRVSLASERTECLLRSLPAFDALLRSLGTLSGDELSRAPGAADALPSLADCSEDALLRQQAERLAPPPDAGPAAYARLSEASIALKFNERAAAAEEIEALLEIATVAEDPVLRIKTLLLRSSLEYGEDRLSDAESTAREAVEASELLGDTLLRVDAQMRLAKSLAGGGVSPLGRDLARFSRAALERLGNPPRRVAALLSVEAVQALHDGDQERSVRLGRARLTLLRSMNPPPKDAIGHTQSNIAVTLLGLGRPDEAVEEMRASLALFEENYGETAVGTIKARMGLAEALSDLGSVEEATMLARKAVADADRSAGGRRSLLAARARGALGVVLAGSGHLDEAEPLFREQAELFERTLEPDNPEVVGALMNYARLLAYVEKPAEAVKVLERALKQAKDALPENHPDYVFLYKNLATATINLERWPEAERAARRALEASSIALGPEHTRTARARRLLGMALAGAGKPALAEQELEQALRQLRVNDARSAMVAETRFALAGAVDAQGDRARARALVLQARQEYEDDGAPMREELASIDAWLAAHP